MPCRRQSCGHRVDLAPPFSQQEECETCGDVVPFLRASASRDLVPCSSATLTWEWATRTKGRPLKPTEPVRRCVSSSNVNFILDQAATSFARKTQTR